MEIFVKRLVNQENQHYSSTAIIAKGNNLELIK